MEVDSVDSFLEHYGKKGMKWGIRKNIQRLSGAARSQYVDAKDADWVSKVEANPKVSKVARIAARDAKRQTKKLKKDYKDRGLNIKRNSLDRTRYDNELKDILQHSVDRASHKVHGSSPTGLKEVQIHRHPDGSMSATIGTRDNSKIRKQQRKIAKADTTAAKKTSKLDKSIDIVDGLDALSGGVVTTGIARGAWSLLNHADSDAPTAEDFDGLEFLLVLDDEGFVDDILTPFDDEDDVEHDGMEASESFLEHYGTKGMKWGVRKAHRSRPDFMPPVKKSSGKPAWQSAPPKKPAPVAVSSKSKLGRKGKQPKIISEDAAQFRQVKAKVKREGIEALTNKDLEIINKRMELQQKYNKNFPKKKNPLVDMMIDTILGEAGEKHILEYLAPRSPNAAVAARSAILLNRTVRTTTKK